MDTSAFLAGLDPFSITEEQVTAPNVENEIRTKSMVWVRFKTAVENAKLIVRYPIEEAQKEVETCAAAVGDTFFLSETDKQLLALALELKTLDRQAQIVTDDYSIQNVARRLGIEFTPLATFGIRRLLEWIRYCPACRREYPAECTLTACTICGTKLKRKPRKKTLNFKAT